MFAIVTIAGQHCNRWHTNCFWN